MSWLLIEEISTRIPKEQLPLLLDNLVAFAVECNRLASGRLGPDVTCRQRLQIIIFLESDKVAKDCLEHQLKYLIIENQYHFIQTKRH